MEQAYLLTFRKLSGARYLSHLDMARVFLRAFRRLHLPLKFSEGFHAHPKVRFSPPLSVGVESLCETCRFSLIDETRSADELLAALCQTMPDGFEPIALCPVSEKPVPDTHARYRITFPRGAQPLLEGALTAPMTVLKRTKSGERELDLFPHLQIDGIEEDADGCHLTVTCPAAETLTVNPTLVITALQAKGPTLLPTRILKLCNLTLKG